jgi:hypothetical protein
MWQISVPIFALLTLAAPASAPVQLAQTGATQLETLLKTGPAKGYPGAATTLAAERIDAAAGSD